jgi:hypothetical protein
VKKVLFQVLTATSMDMAVFWVVVPCNIALMMEAASISETSVNFYQTTRRNNSEYSHLQQKMVGIQYRNHTQRLNGTKYQN